MGCAGLLGHDLSSVFRAGRQATQTMPAIYQGVSHQGLCTSIETLCIGSISSSVTPAHRWAPLAALLSEGGSGAGAPAAPLGSSGLPARLPALGAPSGYSLATAGRLLHWLAACAARAAAADASGPARGERVLGAEARKICRGIQPPRRTSHQFQFHRPRHSRMAICLFKSRSPSIQIFCTVSNLCTRSLAIGAARCGPHPGAAQPAAAGGARPVPARRNRPRRPSVGGSAAPGARERCLPSHTSWKI